MRTLRILGILTCVAIAGCGGGGGVGGAPGGVSIVATTAPSGTTTGTPATASPTTVPTSAGTTPAPTVTPSAGTTTPPTTAPSAAATTGTAATKIGHVFVVMLENESEDVTYATTAPVAAYLNDNVKPAGAFIPNYYSTGHVSNDNYISLISGQAPNVDTSSDCQIYSDFTSATTTTDGQAAGVGCVFPTSVPNITDQLMAAGITWKSYDEDMGNDPSRESSTCGHPTLNSQDGTQSAATPGPTNNEMGDQYATRHNPFMYFHSIIDNTAYCASHVVNSTALMTDLQSVATTPQYVFYTPNLCDDGHDSPCVTGQAGGLASIDAFMKSFVPMITSSPAFQQDGLLLILFDEAATSDATSCCGEMAGPTDPEPGLSGAGGGDVGAVLISPFIAPGTVSMSSYNHYAALESLEDVFGLTHIGYAQASGLATFGTDVFTAANKPTNAYKRVLEYGVAHR